METFLQQVARRILAENPGATEQVLVVFNNHRSELFLKRQFEKISAAEGSTFFLPQTTVIDDLVAQLGGAEVVPPEFLLFELYRIHVEMEGDERKYQTFEEFIPFGEMMLNDFSEIDRYMVDARDLFQNLHGMKQIGEWDIEDPHMSEFQRSYLRFYHSLYEYYNRLRQRLSARGQAYAGMAYRSVAERIGQLADGCEWRSVYFVGFNAISECERTIIGEFVQRGCGHLLTDGDAYYYNDKQQEAGYFLRRHSGQFAELGHYGESLFATTKKKITIVECPENVLQCKFAGQILSSHPKWLADNADSDSTAVVLADESLLMATLGGLPDIEGCDYKVNITMGFPFADSQMHGLAQKLLSLYRRHNARGYYHSDVVEVLADALVSQTTGMTAARHTVGAYLEKSNLVRVEGTQLAELMPTTLTEWLLPDVEMGPDECLAQLRRVVARLLESGVLEHNPRERQAAGALAEVLDYLERLQDEYHFMTSIDTLEKIYLRIAQRHTIAFLGQPLSGLQILGMLETRNLDFRHIILLSAGEGVLPAARSTATLIPHELKRAFHLPTYEERDSVYAYNFYRLLQRAEDVYLVYSSDANSAGKGEESRLLKQVRGELARRYPQTITVEDWVVDTGGQLHRVENSVPGGKDDKVMQRLYQISDKYGFSPTALGRYAECPLKYYYMSVLGLREDEGLEDDIDASQLGEAIHNVLKTVYEPFIGQRVQAAALDEARNNVEALLDNEMQRLMSGGRSLEGRNMFLRSVALTQLSRVLEREAVIATKHTLEMVATEQDYSYTLWEQDSHPIRISGRVDRIDRLDGVLRVIDYKTGSLNDSEIEFTDRKNTMPGKWLQLMCYALMYRRNHPDSETLRTGIYPLRYLRSDVRLARWNRQEEMTASLIDEFENLMHTMLAELTDKEKAFAASPSTNACRFCPAASFCPAKRQG